MLVVTKPHQASIGCNFDFMLLTLELRNHPIQFCTSSKVPFPSEAYLGRIYDISSLPHTIMASKPGSFLINLKLRKSSNVEEIHDIVLGEVIRASSATTERDRTKIIGNGDSSIVRNLRVNSTSVKSVAVSPPFIGIVLDNGKACRYKITERSDVFTDRSVGEAFQTFYRKKSSLEKFVRKFC